MKYYKILDHNGRSCYGGTYKWALPDGDRPGRRTNKVKGEILECGNGYHLCREQDLIYWVQDYPIWEAEPWGDIIESDSKVICRSARLVRKMPWDNRCHLNLLADIAERCLGVWEAKYPKDKRPRQAVAATRAYANNDITRNMWEARLGDACNASYNTAIPRLIHAAAAAGRNNARLAAFDSQMAVAASDSPRCDDPVLTSERAWQTARLMEYLNGNA